MFKIVAIAAVGLSGQNWLAVAKFVQERGGRNAQCVAERCKGYTVFVRKPFQIFELVDLVAELVARPATADWEPRTTCTLLPRRPQGR